MSPLSFGYFFRINWAEITPKVGSGFSLSLLREQTVVCVRWLKIYSVKLLSLQSNLISTPAATLERRKKLTIKKGESPGVLKVSLDF